jgi:hypothetical protein
MHTRPPWVLQVPAMDKVDFSGVAAQRVIYDALGCIYCRSTERRYFVSCGAPASSSACPGKPGWISVKAKSGQPGLPEGLNSTVIDGQSTVEFNVTTRCRCSSVYHGIVDFAYYRNLPLNACGK